MPRPVEPSLQHLEAAFVGLRGTDWPTSLHELQMAVSRYGIVLAAARQLANGGRISRPDVAAELSAPVRNFTHPARRDGVRPTLPARRRDDQVIDLKSRAAGEKPDQE